VESSGGFMKNGAQVFLRFLHSVSMVLRSRVLTVLELDEVDVTLNPA
jgi:hypothetical protein